MKTFLKIAARQLLIPSILAVSVFVQAQEFKGPKISDEVKAAIDACVKEKNLPAMTKGERPSRETIEALDTCLKEKGYEMPKPPHHGEHRRKEDSSSASSAETSQGASQEVGDTGAN